MQFYGMRRVPRINPRYSCTHGGDESCTYIIYRYSMLIYLKKCIKMSFLVCIGSLRFVMCKNMCHTWFL